MKKINTLELASIVMMEIIALTLGINLPIIVNNTTINSWLTIILSYIIGFIPLIILILINNYEPDLPIYKKINKLFGNILGFIINTFIIIIFIILAMTILYNINNFIVSQFLYHTPILVSSLVLILLSIYLNTKKKTTLTRLSLILIGTNALLYLFSFLTLTFEIDLENFYPLLKVNTDKIFISSLKVMVINTLPLLSILFISKNSLTKPDKYNKTLIISYISGAIIAITILLSTVGTMGEYLSVLFQYPEYVVLRRVKLFSFLERVENLVSVQWIIGAFVYISTIIAYIKYTVNDLYIKNKKIKYLTPIVIGLIIYFIAIKTFDNSTTFNNYINSYFPIVISSLGIIYAIVPIKIAINKISKVNVN